jgi:ribosomal protein L16 Arg81 hydroxylase
MPESLFRRQAKEVPMQTWATTRTRNHRRQPDGPRPHDLSWLLGSVAVDSFVAGYWEQQPLVVRREAPDYYARLMTFDDFDALLAHADAIVPHVELVRNGAQVRVEDYTYINPLNPGELTRCADLLKVFALFQQGCTLVFNALDRSWPPLAPFCRALETELSTRVHVNAYVTPPSAQGFGLHHDTHDVLVLQIAGAKTWRIYDDPVKLPLPSQQYRRLGRPQPGKLLQEVELTAGDLLYLPRGFCHEAAAGGDDISAHLTVGLHAVTWYDVLSKALERLAQADPRFRRGLPAGFARHEGDHGSERAVAAELLEVFRSVDVAADIERLAQQFTQDGRPLLRGYLSDLRHCGALGLDSVLRPRPGVPYRIGHEGDLVTLAFHSKKLGFPDHAEPALRFVAETPAFAVAALPDCLEDDDKLEMVRHLVQEGFLTRADDELPVE